MESNPQLKEAIGGTNNTHDPSHDSAVGLFTLPNLRSLELWLVMLVKFDNAFYEGDGVTAAGHSQV